MRQDAVANTIFRAIESGTTTNATAVPERTTNAAAVPEEMTNTKAVREETADVTEDPEETTHATAVSRSNISEGTIYNHQEQPSGTSSYGEIGCGMVTSEMEPHNGEGNGRKRMGRDIHLQDSLSKNFVPIGKRQAKSKWLSMVYCMCLKKKCICLRINNSNE